MNNFIFQNENYKEVGKEGKPKRLVREVTIQDRTGSIRVSLWEGAALHSNFDLGQRLRVHDSKISHNNYFKDGGINVNHLDLITVSIR